MSSEVFGLLFQFFIRSLLAYGYIVGSSCYQVHVDLLDRVQNKFLRHFNFRFPHTSIDVPTLVDRRMAADLKSFNKILDGRVNCSKLLDMVRLDRHQHLRGKKTFYIKHCPTNYTYYAPIYLMMRRLNPQARVFSFDDLIKLSS